MSGISEKNFFFKFPTTAIDITSAQYILQRMRPEFEFKVTKKKVNPITQVRMDSEPAHEYHYFGNEIFGNGNEMKYWKLGMKYFNINKKSKGFF